LDKFLEDSLWFFRKDLGQASQCKRFPVRTATALVSSPEGGIRKKIAKIHTGLGAFNLDIHGLLQDDVFKYRIGRSLDSTNIARQNSNFFGAC
jgi:hypothetical protein